MKVGKKNHITPSAWIDQIMDMKLMQQRWMEIHPLDDARFLFQISSCWVQSAILPVPKQFSSENVSKTEEKKSSNKNSPTEEKKKEDQIDKTRMFNAWWWKIDQKKKIVSKNTTKHTKSEFNWLAHSQNDFFVFFIYWRLSKCVCVCLCARVLIFLCTVVE